MLEEFKLESGVKQGDSLSEILFTIVVDVILKQLDLRGNISTCVKQCAAYADDTLVTTITKQQ
jgi:retron-type reverse transcriptase